MHRRWVISLGVAITLATIGILGFRTWSIRSSLRRAERACAIGQWSLATRILSPLLDREPGNLDAHLLMARAQFGSGEWHAGLEHLRQIPESSPFFVEAKFYEGSAMLELDRGAQAERAFRECLRLDPESIPARQRLVTLFLWEDRRVEARQLAWEVYERAPPEHRAAALGQVFRVDYAEFPVELRRTRLERFVALNPHDWDAMAALANLYSSSSDPSMRGRAAPMLREALQQQPDNVAARIALVTAAIGEDHDEAKHLVDTWPADPRDERYVVARGMVQQECDLDFIKAADSFRRVLETHPDNWRVRGRFAVCLRMLDQPEQANLQMKRQTRVSDALNEDIIGQLILAEETQLATAPLRYRLGQLYETVGRWKDARCWYQEVLRVEPSHQATKDAIDRLKDKPDVQPVDEE
jgi:thioredoxin-like negative regulator of GroEL